MKKLNLHLLKKVMVEYPMVILSACLFYLFIYLEIEDYNLEYDVLGFILSSAIPLFFGINMLSKKIGKIWILRIIGLVLLIVYFYVLPNSKEDFTALTTLIVIPIFIFLHLFVAVAKDITKNNRETSFWNYNKNLFVNFVISLVFSGVLAAGALSVLRTFESLFELDIISEVYFEIALFILIIGNTFIFLLFDYKTAHDARKEAEFPVVLKFFTQYVLIPIMLLYTFVLYLYALKILISWELPQGWLSYGILSYAIVGILAILLVYPLREESKKSWVRWFYKIFFYSLIPLLILLFIAIGTRLSAYGFTEPRYYVLALSIWLSVCTLYYLLYSKATISFIPKSLMLTIVIGLVFPYFNAFSVSVRSQQKEINKILNNNSFIKDGKIDYQAEVNYQTLLDVNNKFRYLKERNATAALEQSLGLEQKDSLDNQMYSNLLDPDDFDNLVNDNHNSFGDENYKTIYARRKLIKLKENLYLWSPDKYNNNSITINQDTLDFISNANVIEIRLNDAETFDLNTAVNNYIEETIRNNEKFNDNSLKEISFTTTLDHYKIEVYIERLYGRKLEELNKDIQYIIVEDLE